MRLRLTTFIVVYLAGLFTMMALFIKQTITAFNTIELSDVFILITIGFLILTMGFWWLPIVAKITGLQPQSQSSEENI